MDGFRKRLPEISALNVFLCILVLFIHISSYPILSYDKGGPLYAAVFIPWKFSGFVVPGFIFLSGLRLFLNRGDSFGCRAFYKSRLTGVVLPYILWNAIYYAYFVLKGYFGFSFADFGRYILRGDLVGHLYFVVTIIQFYALMPLWNVLVKKADWRASLLVSAVLTVFLGQKLPSLISSAAPDFVYNDRVFTTYLLYWVAGCYAGRHYEAAVQWVRKNIKATAAAFSALLISEETLGYLSSRGLLHFGWLETLHFLYCAGAVLFFFAAAVLLFRDRALGGRLFGAVDRSVYRIYLSHCLFIFLVNDLMSALGLRSTTVSYVIRLLFVYSAAVLFGILSGRLKAALKPAVRH